MTQSDTHLVDEAIKFATEAHSGVMRKGGEKPYILHTLEAMLIASEISCDQRVLAAAVLHDVIEDTPYTYDDIKTRFGEYVADLVMTETDVVEAGESYVANWEEVKRRSMEKIKNGTRDMQIVALGDKLSNMRAIASDYEKMGEKLWEKFNVNDKSRQGARYKTLLEAFPHLTDTPQYKEFATLIEKVFS